MKEKEKVTIIDKVLETLNRVNIGTVPEMLNGTQNYPIKDSDLDRKYRIVEHELIRLELAEKLEGGDNSTAFGYIYIKLLPKGMDYVISKKSIAELYEKADNEQLIEQKINQLTLEKLEYDKTIRNQEQRIRDLTEDLKAVSLSQKYWWVLITLLGVGFAIGKMIFG